MNFGPHIDPPEVRRTLYTVIWHKSIRHVFPFGVFRTMSRHTFRPLEGAAPSHFYQGFTAHTTTGTGVPQNIFNRENLKFGLKYSV